MLQKSLVSSLQVQGQQLCSKFAATCKENSALFGQQECVILTCFVEKLQLVLHYLSSYLSELLQQPDAYSFFEMRVELSCLRLSIVLLAAHLAAHVPCHINQQSTLHREQRPYPVRQTIISITQHSRLQPLARLDRDPVPDIGDLSDIAGLPQLVIMCCGQFH